MIFFFNLFTRKGHILFNLSEQLRTIDLEHHVYHRIYLKYNFRNQFMQVC